MGSQPVLFERWSGSVADPKFDSEILEGQFRRSTAPQIRLRLRVALLYVLISSLAWTLFFSSAHDSAPGMALGSFSLAALSGAASVVTRTAFYKRRVYVVGGVASGVLCLATLLGFMGRDGSPVSVSLTGLSSMAIQVLLLNYTVMPLPLYACVVINIVYSIAFEILAALVGEGCGGSGGVIFARCLFHLCVHVIGLHILVKSQVRMRSMFMKVGQSLLVRCQLEMEKHLKEKMIHSVMPPKVAEWLMSEAVAEESVTMGEDGERSECSFGLRKVSSPRSSNTAATLNAVGKGDDLRSLFRPFNMHRMESVSILFADIVGFTGMSSNKTAEQLVTLLNDLFGRFDVLCGRHGCEKISTLGDCYYCVSGCPEPRPDHALCCVEMGLAMIGAIALFDQERKESVDMRVGVHTGTVLCGIVGTKRFKFDVWSNDVTLANRMESTGRPGKVHVSEKTLAFLQNQYYVQPAEPVQGLKTYFILGRRAEMVTQALAVEPWLCPPSPLQQSPVRHHPCPTQGLPLSNLPHMDEKKSSSLPSVFDPSKGAGVSIRDLEEMAIKKNPKKRRESRRKGLATLQRLKRASERRQPLLDRGANGITNGDSFRSRSKTMVHGASEGVNLGQLSPGSLSLSHGSIQQQICAMNGIAPECGGHAGSRVSSYYTASHSTINDPTSTNDVSPVATSGGSGGGPEAQIPLNEKLAQSLQLRKQSDMQMIRCIQDDSSHRQYFLRPPLHLATLFFLDKDMERAYRQCAHCYDEGPPTTLTSPKVNTIVDVGVAAVVVALLCIAMFASFPPSIPYAVIFPLATLTVSAALYTVIRHSRLLTGKQSWVIRHVTGGIVVSIPAIITLSNAGCTDLATLSTAALVSLVHFCDFSQLGCWARTGLAALAGAATVGICVPCPAPAWQHWELGVCILLTLILVGFLNREFEMGFRLGFHCAKVAAQDRKRVQTLKDQADWLLHNIIPRHVAERLKTEAKYSQNHRRVGIVFASIVNFNEMYDETYQGGKEYLRVLNELIGDFDELLDLPQYHNVEKIKTIGSTFMAASGLNPQARETNEHPDQHLFELVDFALEMQDVIAEFNRDLIEFNLILRVGLNFGDVTAGVIGTTKLYYDIWGDAVNISSRMDTTGVQGRIQVSQACVPVLQDRYELEERGDIYVKGKDHMLVYLLNSRKKEEVSQDRKEV